MLSILKEYFNQLIHDENIPSGYHDLKLSHTNGDILLTLECTTSLKGVNKLIPKIIDNIIDYSNGLLEYLRHNFLENDFLIITVRSGITYIEYTIRMFKSYLSLELIPADIFSLIIPHLDKEDYFNLVDIIKLKEYPDLIQQLKYITNSSSVSRIESRYHIISEYTIDEQGHRIEIYTEYFDDKLFRKTVSKYDDYVVTIYYPDGKVKSITTKDTFQRWDENGGLVESTNMADISI